LTPQMTTYCVLCGLPGAEGTLDVECYPAGIENASLGLGLHSRCNRSCCLNCGQVIRAEQVFCSPWCKSMASQVRYRRGLVGSPRLTLPAVLEALTIQEAWLFSGAVYQRRLTERQRQEVFRLKGRRIDVHILLSAEETEQLREQAAMRQQSISSLVAEALREVGLIGAAGTDA
jgi:hypothetical protein